MAGLGSRLRRTPSKAHTASVRGWAKLPVVTRQAVARDAAQQVSRR